MIELFNEFLKMIHQISETFLTIADWFGDAFMQVGLVFVITYGYLRHWVSEIFQCQ